jgi:hypothetical protein
VVPPIGTGLTTPWMSQTVNTICELAGMDENRFGTVSHSFQLKQARTGTRSSGQLGRECSRRGDQLYGRVRLCERVMFCPVDEREGFVVRVELSCDVQVREHSATTEMTGRSDVSFDLATQDIMTGPGSTHGSCEPA